MLDIAGSTSKELARQVSYLKAENQIRRRRLPKRLIQTDREKNRLVRFAKNLGSELNELTTIVHPSTSRGWIREASNMVTSDEASTYIQVAESFNKQDAWSERLVC
jgi:putative transposase